MFGQLLFGLAPTPAMGGGGSADAFMAGLTKAAQWRFLLPDRNYQEPTGPAPSAAASDTIGLSLSDRLWGGKTYAAYLAAQPGLLTNPGFVGSFSPWAPGLSGEVSWVSDGVVSLNRNTGTNSRLTQPASVIAGRTYRLSARALRTVSTGNMVFLLRDAPGGSALSVVLNYNTSSDEQFAFWTSTVTGMVYPSFERTTTDGIGQAYAASLKEVTRYAATQASLNFRPKLQVTGAKFDGSDDRLVTEWAITGDAFALFPDTDVPATLSGTQVLGGALDGSSNGDYLGITTGGALRARVGQTTLDSAGIDLRGGVHDVGYWTEGDVLYLYANGVIVASGPRTGARPTTAWTLGGLNNNGTPSNFFGGSLTAVRLGDVALSLARANQLSF